MENVDYGLGYGYAIPFKSPSSTTKFKSDNTYLEDSDDHKSETRQKAPI